MSFWETPGLLFNNNESSRMTQSNTTMNDSKRLQLSKGKMKSKYARECKDDVEAQWAKLKVKEAESLAEICIIIGCERKK